MPHPAASMLVGCSKEGDCDIDSLQDKIWTGCQNMIVYPAGQMEECPPDNVEAKTPALLSQLPDVVLPQGLPQMMNLQHRGGPDLFALRKPQKCCRLKIPRLESGPEDRKMQKMKIRDSEKIDAHSSQL